MEKLDLSCWSHVLLSCHSDKDYVNALVLVPRREWRLYLLRDPQACLKRRLRFGYCILHTNGTREWRYQGQLHRENDMPAVVYAYGLRSEWWYLGQRHREDDMPAVVYAKGARSEWWYKGQRHRENNMPAIVCADGTQEWLCADGIQQWWYKDQRHREKNMPAIVYADGTREWWYNGVYMDKK